jgi:pimeloyl-ACP methyl ester carboxylesterase
MASAIQKIVQSGKIKANDVELYYEIRGDGVPIVFIHGAIENLYVWRFQTEFFSDKYKVIAYDVRGQGKSDKPHGEYSIQIFANDLYALLQGLKIEKAIIAGYSSGGFVALQFALDHPEMVSKLVLIDTAAKFSDSIIMPFMMWLLSRILPYETNIRNLINTQSNDRTPEEREAAFKMLTGTPKYVALKLQSANNKFDVRDKISKIKAPTLIIVGEKDTILPVEKSQFLNREIKGSKLVVIPNAKHTTIPYNAKEVNQAIEEFIK